MNEEFREEVMKKLGWSEEKIDNYVEKIRNKVEEMHGDEWSDERINKKVELLSVSGLKDELRSSAVAMEGMILGVGEPYDYIRDQRKEAMNRYREDPEQAVKEGYTDEDGVPLDRTGKYTQQGTELPKHAWIRNVYGVAMFDGSPDLFTMVLSDRTKDPDKTFSELVHQEIPINKPVRFRANDDDNLTGGMRTLNATSKTNFTTIDKDLPDAKKMYDEIVNDKYKYDLSELDNAYNIQQQKQNSWTVSRGTVSHVDSRPNSAGSFRVALNSDSLPMDSLVDVFVPQEVFEQVEAFSMGSEVYVNGRVSKNNDQYNMNAFGIVPVSESILGEEFYEM